jgi:hypothetical protein
MDGHDLPSVYSLYGNTQKLKGYHHVLTGNALQPTEASSISETELEIHWSTPFHLFPAKLNLEYYTDHKSSILWPFIELIFLQSTDYI